MTDWKKMRKRALEFDAEWQKAFDAEDDCGPVIDRALEEGFVPTKPAPPEMFAHVREIEGQVAHQDRIVRARQLMEAKGVDFGRVRRRFDDRG